MRGLSAAVGLCGHQFSPSRSPPTSLCFFVGALGSRVLGLSLQWVFPWTWAPGRGVGDIVGWVSSHGELESPCDSFPRVGTSGVPLNLMSQGPCGESGAVWWLRSRRCGAACHLLLMGDSCSGTALTQHRVCSAPVGAVSRPDEATGCPSFLLGAWSQAQLPLPPDRLTRSGMP